MENKEAVFKENSELASSVERVDTVPFVLSKDDILTLINDDFISFLSNVEERAIASVFNSYIDACGIFVFTKALGKISKTISSIKIKDVTFRDGSIIKIDKVYLDVNGVIEEVDVSEPYKVQSLVRLSIANDLSLAHGILKLSSLIGEKKLDTSYKLMRVAEDAEGL